MKTAKIFVVFVLVLSLLLSGCNNPVKKQKISIGFIGPLTGGDSLVGQSVVKGIRLAQDNIHNTKFEYDFFLEDDAGETKQSINAYNKLKSINGIKALIGVYSPQGNALSPLVEQDKVIYCDAGASDGTISAGKKYSFLHWVSPKTEAVKYADKIESLGYKKVVSIESLISGVTAVSNQVKIELEKRDIEFEQNKIDKKETDFRTVLSRLNKDEFDAFLFFLFPSHSAPALKQIKELGFQHPLTSIEFFEFYTEEELRQLQREEDWYIFASDPNLEFINVFSAKHSDEPWSLAPHGYDCVNIIIDAFEKANGDVEKAIEIIHSLQDYSGAVGTLYYENGRIESPAVIKRYLNGEFIVVN